MSLACNCPFHGNSIMVEANLLTVLSFLAVYILLGRGDHCVGDWFKAALFHFNVLDT